MVVGAVGSQVDAIVGEGGGLLGDKLSGEHAGRDGAEETSIADEVWAGFKGRDVFFDIEGVGLGDGGGATNGGRVGTNGQGARLGWCRWRGAIVRGIAFAKPFPNASSKILARPRQRSDGRATFVA